MKHAPGAIASQLKRDVDIEKVLVGSELASDDIWPRLSHLANLSFVVCHGQDIGAAVQQLDSLRHLTAFEIFAPGVNQALKHLSALPHLEEIQITGPHEEPIDVSLLGDIRRLTHVMFKRTSLSHDNIVALAKCPQLQWLFVLGPSFEPRQTISGLSHLRSATSFKEIQLQNVIVDDDLLAELGAILSLEVIMISNDLSEPSEFTTNGLRNLDGLKQLKSFSGKSESISKAEWNEFQSAHPRMKLY